MRSSSSAASRAFGDAAGQGREFVGGKPRRARHGLAMTEKVAHGNQLVGMRLRHFDEIAQHAIMLDLELRHIRLLAILGFQACDDAAGFMRQRAQFIQRRMDIGFYEAAIAGEIGRLVHQQQFQPVGRAATPPRCCL